MKAAILTELNAPLTVCEVEPILPLSYGQVLVDVLAAGICGAQLQEIRGEKGGPLPHLMGHEGCGIVAAIGPGVSRVKVGDKVVMHWRKAAGIESAFPIYRFSDKSPRHSPQGDGGPASTFTSGLVTTWAEQAVVSENRLTPVPADTPDDLCVMLGCGLSTALATVETETRGFGESVLVIGCGGLGLNLLSSLQNLAAPARVCVCDIHENKRRRAEILDAEFFNLNQAQTPTGPFDLILDTVGHPATSEAALEQLAPSGRYVFIGQPAPGKPICIRNARHLFDGEGKTIKATQGGGFRPDLDIPRYLRIAGNLSTGRTITHTFPLEQINAALDLVRAGEAGRVLIEMKKQPLISANDSAGQLARAA